MKLYAVRDIKVGKYGTPFIMDNDLTATRSFLLSLADCTRPTVMTAYPHDYELYEVGEYNHDNGSIQPLGSGVRFVASASSCLSEFSSMQQNFINLAESYGTKAITDKVKSKLVKFKSSFLHDISDFYHDLGLDTPFETFLDCVKGIIERSLHSVDLNIGEDNPNE